MRTGILAVVGLLLAASGCKLQIEVPANGRVTTTSGNYTCESGQSCEIEVLDTSFNETFVAEPVEGYFFDGWKNEQGYFCWWARGNCRLQNAFVEGNDTFLDILASDRSWSMAPKFATYTMLRNNGYVSVENIQGITAASYARPEATISLDANNDGQIDLLMGPSNWDAEPEFPLALFINQGGGVFVEDAAGVIDNVPTVGQLNHPSIVADFNGDGADDVFLVDQGLEIGTPPFAGHQPGLLLSNGAGGLTNASDTHLPPFVAFHHTAAVGDIDLDGDLDILGADLNNIRAYILLNDGSGRFTLRTDRLPQDIVSEEANWDVGTVTLAYINNDNRLDIVFGTYKSAPQMLIAVALQDETGDFPTSQVLELGETFANGGIDLLLAEDLDGDGDDDLIGKIDESTLPGEETEGGSGEIGLLALRNDNGVLTNVTNTWLGGSLASQLVSDTRISGLFLEDVNGDGHKDLLFAHTSIPLNELGQYLFLNNGKGRFRAAPQISVDSDFFVGPQWYTDHDGDGDVDIVVIWPDITEVDGNFISTGYEIIVLERN